MDFLELHTIVFIGVLISAICTFLVGDLWHQNRARFNGLGLLVADNLCRTAGLGLLFLRSSIPDCLEITAEAIDDGEIMGIKHKKYPIYGVQFHPESILCEDGQLIIKNFLEAKP